MHKLRFSVAYKKCNLKMSYVLRPRNRKFRIRIINREVRRRNDLYKCDICIRNGTPLYGWDAIIHLHFNRFLKRTC